MRAVWSEKRGWCFRAEVNQAGRRKYGSLRDTQEAAAEDRTRMLEELERKPIRCVTLGEAIESVLTAARRRSVPEFTLRKMRSQSRYLTRFWKPSAPMERIDRNELLDFVRCAREVDRRSPNTILQKDLPMLAQCYKAAGVTSPVAGVREELRQTLKYVPPTMEFFDLGEVRDVLHRMRHAEFRRQPVACRYCRTQQTTVIEQRPGVDQPRKCGSCGKEFTVRSNGRGRVAKLANRGRDADLFELLALSGIRSGELGRVTVGAIDRQRQRIRVISKDRGHPRWVEVVGPLVRIVEELRTGAVDHARARGADPSTELLVPNSMDMLCGIARRWKIRLCEPRLAARTFRHSFVTGVLASGGAAHEARALAGHRKLDTTDKYVHEISALRAHRVEEVARRLHQDVDDPTDE